MKTPDEKWAELRKVVAEHRAERSLTATNLRLRERHEDAALFDALALEARTFLGWMDRIDAEGK